VAHVAGGIRQVDDDAGADQKVVEFQLGDVLAGGEKVDLAVQVGAQVVAMGKELPVGPAVSNCTTRWRFRRRAGQRTLLHRDVLRGTMEVPFTEVGKGKIGDWQR
jgi:hypothetical protein